jgi:hypothetical protein
VNKKD